MVTSTFTAHFYRNRMKCSGRDTEKGRNRWRDGWNRWSDGWVDGWSDNNDTINIFMIQDKWHRRIALPSSV